MAAQDWYRHALCKIHLDMHCPEWHESILSKFDAERIVSTVAAAGTEALYVFAKDCYGNSYYQTQIGHRHRCLGDRDFLSEFLEAGRRYDMPIVAYYSVIWDNRAAEGHTDWRMRDEQDRVLLDTVTTDTGKWMYLCHNSGYADYAESMMAELATAYDVDGFHLDMFNLSFGGLSCYCENCERLFRETYGTALPRVPTWDATWRDFLEFRYRSVERFAQRLRAAVHHHRPGLCVVMNYHAAPNFDWHVGQQPVRHSLYSDLSTGETYTPMFGAMYPGMASCFARNLQPGKPFEMVAWRMNRITDFTTKPEAQLRWELATVVAHGGSTMLIDQPFHDGQLDPVAYDRVGKIFSECEEIRPHLVGDFRREIGIYYSARSRDLYGREALDRFLQPIMGTHKAVVENHRNVDFIFDETVTAELLSTFPVVILANVGAMTAKEVDLFTDYVRQGGHLIATAATSRFDECGEPLSEFQMAELFGVRYIESNDCDNCFFSNLPEPYGTHIDGRDHILCQGQVEMVAPTTAEPFGDLREAFFKRSLPDRFFSHNIHPPYTRISAAGFKHDVGQGTCIYIPFRLGASYADHYELPEHRILWGNLIRSFKGESPITVEAPLNTEVIVRETVNAFYVHLVTYNPLRQAKTLPRLDDPLVPSQRMEEPLLYRAALLVRDSSRAVKSLRSTRIEQTGPNRHEFTTNEVHEVLVVEKS